MPMNGNAEPFKALENQAGDHQQSDGPKSGDAAGPVPDGLVPLVALGLLPLPVVRVPGEPFQLEQRPGAGAEQHRPGHTQKGGRAAGETGRTRRIQDEHRDAAEQPRDCQGHQYDLLLHVPSSS